MKRLINCSASEIAKLTKQELLLGIEMSEGRVMMSECTTSDATGAMPNASLPELYAAMGADMIMLNVFDVYNPYIAKLPVESPEETIRTLKRFTGKVVGTNLEAVPDVTDSPVQIDVPVPGRVASKETFLKSRELGLDFICLTGNPNTGVTNDQIIRTVALAKETIGEDVIIIAGKMHAAGSITEAGPNIVSKEIIKAYVDAGADIIMIPAPGSVPGFTLDYARDLALYAKSLGALAMSAIGTSQEDSDMDTMKTFAFNTKQMGVDIHHIGDAGYAGVAAESMFVYSTVVRGKRHTFNRMATSPLR